MGREFRKFFVPENDDYLIIDADYSQIELRLLAHISGDDNMISAFTGGADIHTSTAQRVFGVDADGVTIELRKKAKAINFGILYGIGEFSLSEDLHISRAEAKRYIESYLAGFPEVSKYLDDVKKNAKANGYVKTLFGRRRYIPEITAQNGNLRAFGKRVAMNAPIQGTAADIMKLAMLRVDRALKAEGLDAKIVMQVHDELIVEVKDEQLGLCREIVRREMENAASLSVPLTVDVTDGKNWLDQM